MSTKSENFPDGSDKNPCRFWQGSPLLCASEEGAGRFAFFTAVRQAGSQKRRKNKDRTSFVRSVF